jgi:hypothetical protein
MRDTHEDNSLHKHRGDRPEGIVPEPRPANFDFHARAPVAVYRRTKDPATENRESGLLFRCPYTAPRTSAAEGVPTAGDGHEPGSPVRVIWEHWRVTQSEFRYRELGIVDLGKIGE